MNKSKKLCAIGFFALLLVAPGIVLASGTEKHPAPIPPRLGSGSENRVEVEARSSSESEDRELRSPGTESRQEVTDQGTDADEQDESETERIPEDRSKGSGTERR